MPIQGPLPGVVQQAAAAWNGFGVLWHGCDGSLWDLTDGDGGVVLTPDGVKGLSMPTFDRYTTDSPSLAGSRYRGSRTKERSVLWPLFVWSSEGSQDFLDRDRQLWRSFRPDEKGTWEVILPDGSSSRKLDLRFVDDNDKTYGLDPALYGWAVYALDLVADDLPYWYGADIIAGPFKASADSPFFLSSGGVVHISAGNTTANAKMSNPGDVDAWARFVITGGHGGAVAGVGAGAVTVPAMANGQTWTIDTRPDRQTAIDQAGVDHSAAVTWNPAPIPRGAEVDLTLNLTGPDADASIEVVITPNYFRAW